MEGKIKYFIGKDRKCSWNLMKSTLTFNKFSSTLKLSKWENENIEFSHFPFPGLHRHLVDCPWRGTAHAASLPSQATQNMEKVSHENLHGGSGRGQLNSDEERLEAVSLSIKVSPISCCPAYIGSILSYTIKGCVRLCVCHVTSSLVWININQPVHWPWFKSI